MRKEAEVDEESGKMQVRLGYLLWRVLRKEARPRAVNMGKEAGER